MPWCVKVCQSVRVAQKNWNSSVVLGLLHLMENAPHIVVMNNTREHTLHELRCWIIQNRLNQYRDHLLLSFTKNKILCWGLFNRHSINCEGLWWHLKFIFMVFWINVSPWMWLLHWWSWRYFLRWLALSLKETERGGICCITCLWLKSDTPQLGNSHESYCWQQTHSEQSTCDTLKESKQVILQKNDPTMICILKSVLLTPPQTFTFGLLSDRLERNTPWWSAGCTHLEDVSPVSWERGWF